MKIWFINDKNVMPIIILAISGLGLFYAIKDSLIFLKKLDSLNCTTVGTITDLNRVYPNLAEETYGSYEYYVADKKYSQNEELGIGLNNRPLLKVGDSIVVHYNPQRPEEANSIEKKIFINCMLYMELLFF